MAPTRQKKAPPKKTIGKKRKTPAAVDALPEEEEAETEAAAPGPDTPWGDAFDKAKKKLSELVEKARPAA